MKLPTRDGGGSATRARKLPWKRKTDDDGGSFGLCDTLADRGESPLELFAHEEVRARVEQELKQISEPYRTTVVLRDIEGLAYEEIAEVLQISLGTVKSRLIRGRNALRERLEPFVNELGHEVGRASRRGVSQDRTALPGEGSGGIVMRCTEAKPLFSSVYGWCRDGVEMHEVSNHLNECAKCQSEYASLEKMREIVAGLGRKHAPPELALKLHIAIASEKSRRRQNWLTAYSVRCRMQPMP